MLGDEGGELEADSPALVVERTRPFKRGQLVKFEGLEDRGAVEELAGRYLLLPIAGVDRLEDGEVFYHQLLGASVVTADGTEVGTVREVYETEPAHLLEVKSAAATTVLEIGRETTREELAKQLAPHQPDQPRQPLGAAATAPAGTPDDDCKKD